MKAALLTGIRALHVREVPEPPAPAAGEVLLQVGTVGICGSDVHYYTTGRIGSQVVHYPFCVGHEFSAVVLVCGAGVEDLAPGQRVAVDPAMPCGTCDQCCSGRSHTCRTLRFLGCPGQASGCLCERITMPAACCVPVADGTSLDTAALVEPLSIGVYAVACAGSLGGRPVGILGSGPIGLSVLLAAKQAGASRIYVTDKLAARLQVASAAGVAWTGNPDEVDVVARIRQAEPLLLQAVFECCGQQSALDQAVDLLTPGGRLMLVGIPETDRVSFAIDTLRRQELTLQNVRRQNECVKKALDLVEKKGLNIDFMATHHFSLEDAGAAFELVAGYGDGVMKAMVTIGKD